MQKVNEAYFTIDGVKSCIHCLYQNIEQISGDIVPEHYHYHDYIEILYATDADMCVWVNGECHNFKTGDIIVINSNEAHTFTYLKKSYYICVKFLPQILCSDEQTFFEFKYVVPFLNKNSLQKIFCENDLKKINLHNIFKEIMDEWENGEIGHELVIRSDILRIFAEIFRYWYSNNQMNEKVILTDEIKLALSYIYDNYDTVTEKEVADMCGLSYNYFSALFKKNTGRTFNEHLTAIKLHEAEKLLITTDKSITDIAYLTGFSSASHFISLFKNYKKMTPKQFRNRIN